MECPFCGNTRRIIGKYIRVRGDQSRETETIVEQVLKYVCRNPQCTHREEVTEDAVRIF